MNENEIYSQSVTKNEQTYIFEASRNDIGQLLLRISKIGKVDYSIERRHLDIEEENVDVFAEVFEMALREFRKIDPAKPTHRAEYLEKIRRTHGQAYMPWTKEDDSRLESLIVEGKKVAELARLFGRQAGAIRARIKKLDLEEKYGI
jgi:hypothetical protein